MKDTLTKALIYESQGYTDEARRICLALLDENPANAAALELLKTLEPKQNDGANLEMLSYFMSEDKDEINKFKRWLLAL